MESPNVDIPHCAEHIWEWFWTLRSFAAVGLAGPDPVTPRDIRDWADLSGTEISREEFDMLLKMDSTYRSAWSEEAENNMSIQRDEWEQQK